MMRPLCEIAATVVLGLLTGSLLTLTLHGIVPTVRLLHGLLVYLQGAGGELARGGL